MLLKRSFVIHLCCLKYIELEQLTFSRNTKHLTNLFSVFGNPSFVDSDRGTAFMLEELKGFLHSRGIATSRTTAFNPQSNGQVERYNGIIWQMVSLALRSTNLSIANWEKVLDVALHCIQSLLSTSTNCIQFPKKISYWSVHTYMVNKIQIGSSEAPFTWK